MLCSGYRGPGVAFGSREEGDLGRWKGGTRAEVSAKRGVSVEQEGRDAVDTNTLYVYVKLAKMKTIYMGDFCRWVGRARERAAGENQRADDPYPKPAAQTKCT